MYLASVGDGIWQTIQNPGPGDQGARRASHCSPGSDSGLWSEGIIHQPSLLTQPVLRNPNIRKLLNLALWLWEASSNPGEHSLYLVLWKRLGADTHWGYYLSLLNLISNMQLFPLAQGRSKTQGNKIIYLYFGSNCSKCVTDICMFRYNVYKKLTVNENQIYTGWKSLVWLYAKKWQCYL